VSDRERLRIEYEEIEEETDKAWLLLVEEDSVWLPKSQCSIDEDRNLIYVPVWLAEQKELSE
jgi:hypothetical protein